MDAALVVLHAGFGLRDRERASWCDKVTRTERQALRRRRRISRESVEQGDHAAAELLDLRERVNLTASIDHGQSRALRHGE